jgi:predicted alpha/beta-hydrolase family hydrolase
MSIRRRFASGFGGAVDKAVLSALSYRFQTRRSSARAPHAPDHDPRRDRRALLLEATAFYGRVENFFVEPERPRVLEERRGRLDGGEIVDLKWPSGYQAQWPALRDDYLSFAPNRDAYARLYRHSGGARATMICLHGYRGGNLWIEERAFSARWLYSLGLDVALVTLPFHDRRGGGGEAPVWPSVNVGRTNEGFAQAVFDLRSFMKWRGGPICVTGMSLGGYTTSLLATVEELAFAAPMIPVASFPDLLWMHGEGRAERARAEREGITLEMLREAMAVHTPLLRAPRVPAERMMVVSAEGDRIAPPEHAARLARHFGAEEHRFAGGHLLQLGRADAFRQMARRLGALGLINPR